MNIQIRSVRMSDRNKSKPPGRQLETRWSTHERDTTEREEFMEVMLDEYIAQMEEIKRRIESIKKLSEITHGQLPLAIVTECVYLQFRKILELIAMSSLVANKQALDKMNRSRKKLGNRWNGDAILKLVEGINPDFYPVPIIERPSRHPPAKMDLFDKTDGFLSRGDFSRLYNLCGDLMHADNPLGRKTDYRALWDEGPAWQSRVLELLGCHQIRLVGRDGFCLVHMHEERDGQVHMYEFGRLSGQPPADSSGGT